MRGDFWPAGVQVHATGHRLSVEAPALGLRRDVAAVEGENGAGRSPR